MKFSNRRYILIILVLLISVNVFSQTENKSILPPPLEGLVAVNHPDLKGLEKEVGEQIVSYQETLLKATQTSPTTREKLSDAYGTMGEIYHVYSFIKPAKESYKNASRLAPNNFKWLHLLGKLSFEQNEYYDAIDYFKKTIKISPKYLPSYIYLGNAYLELDLLDVAKQNYEEVLKLNQDNPAALFGLGQIAYSERNFAEAVKYFEQVLERVPDANRVHYSLAIAYRGLKNIEKAKFHLSKQGTVGVKVFDPIYDSLSDLKKGVRLRLLRGKQAFEAKRFKEAKVEFEKVLEKEPKNITALVNLGSTYVQLGEGTNAVKQFEKAISVDPKNTNARYNLAILLAYQKKHFQAIAHLKVVLKTNEKDIDARILLAKELGNANLTQESLKEFSIVFNANPDNENVLIEIVEILIKENRHKEAKNLLEKHILKFPKSGRSLVTLAYLLATSPEKDLRDGKRALELSTKVYNSTKFVQHGVIVAMSYAELGQCEDAAKLTQNLLDAATKAKNQNWIGKLKTELERYKNKKPCSV